MVVRPAATGGLQAPSLQLIIISICFVLTSGAPSIRDVIAFPKTTTGQCLLTEAPSGVSDAQLADLHIAKAGALQFGMDTGQCCTDFVPLSAAAAAGTVDLMNMPPDAMLAGMSAGTLIQPDHAMPDWKH